MTTWLPRWFACLLIVLPFVPVVAADPDDKDIERLVKQLGADEFDQREAASAALNKVGKPALKALRKAATESDDAEVRFRAAALVQAIQDSLTQPIDLAPYVNQQLNGVFHNHYQGNDLAALPTGRQTFAGVRFTVGNGVVQLGTPKVPGKPEKVEGIKVGAKAVKLHFLHSCGRSGGTPADTLVGKYVVHYDDRSTAEVEIVYGKDVVDWWEQRGVADPTRSKVGWEGENEMVKGSGLKIKLFLTTWENPHPDKRIVTIDYETAAGGRQTGAAPFCVAISAEK
jgi:hypothetical protein